MSKDNGGPAFPHEGYARCEGMTLRDYFAAKAMQSIVADALNKGHGSDEDIAEIVSRMSYGFSDAMLAEREK